ncbi:MAG: hypothetical protein R3A13_11560 [Bdellovibrionota bacterium]
MKISVVCHENIARSQVLGHYLEHFLKENKLDSIITVFSCGTTLKPNQYGNENERLKQVAERLKELGLDVQINRNCWNDETAKELKTSDLILAADSERRSDIVTRLGSEVENKTFLFYEFIEEGSKDFTDTYDSAKGAQDPERFDKSFAELKRIAEVLIEKILGDN